MFSSVSPTSCAPGRCAGRLAVQLADGHGRHRGQWASVLNGTVCMAVHEDQNDHIISRQLLTGGSYGHAATFSTILRASPGTIMLDVGANVGFHTVQAAALGHEVVSWEPHPHNVALLRHTLERSACISPLVTLLPNAVSNATHAGQVLTLRSHESSPGMSTLANREAVPVPLGGEGREFRVGMSTVDEGLRNHACAKGRRPFKPISLLKLDVEGFEAFALRGSSRLLSGSLSCPGARGGSDEREGVQRARHAPPPAFVHLEIFPALLRAARTEPSEPLQILTQHGYDLFVGLGEGIGGKAHGAQVATWEALGLRRLTGSSVLSLPVESITPFVRSIPGLQHVDVMAQRSRPQVASRLDLWRGGMLQ